MSSNMQNLSRTQKTVINTVAGLANRMCNILLGFVLRTVFIYTLGVQYTGVSDVFGDILNMLSLSELGISTAISSALYEPLQKKDEPQIRKLMKFYKYAYRLIAFTLFAVGILMLPFMDYLVKDTPDISENLRYIFFLYIVKTSVSYLIIYRRTIIAADQKQYIVKRLDTICTIIRYAVEAICLIIFKEFLLYLYIEIFGTILQNYIVSRQANKHYPYAFEKSDEKLDDKSRKSLLADIKGAALYHISASVGNSVDSVLISSFISTTVLGFVSNYSMIRKQIEMLLKQFFIAATPSVGNLAVSDDCNTQGKAFHKLYYISFMVINFCCISLMILIEPFIRIWLGEKYIMGMGLAFIIAFDSFMSMQTMMVQVFRNANSIFVKGQLRPVLTAVFNVSLSILFIKRFGVCGTFAATIVARILTEWYDAYILYKDIFRESFTRFYIKYIYYAVVFLSGCAVTFYLTKIIDISNAWGNLIVKGILCLIIPNTWAFVLTLGDGLKIVKRRRQDV